MASRRFHDLGYSLWLTFLYFIPYFGWVLVWVPWGIFPCDPRKKHQSPPPNRLQILHALKIHLSPSPPPSDSL